MWVLFGAGSKRKAVKGGLQVDRWRGKCGATRTFVECEFEDKVSVFFVALVDGKSHRFVCTECGEDVELPAAPAAAAPARPAPKAMPEPRRTLSEKEKDKLLAELKKKMSR